MLYLEVSSPWLNGYLILPYGHLTSFTSVGGYPTNTVTTSSGGAFANAKFYVGSRGGVNSFFNGNISSVKIYGIKLDSTQVTQNYNALKGRYGL